MPAPERLVGPAYPRRWGYLAGVGLMVAGVAVAIIGAVVAFGALAGDVDALRRNAGNGEILASLERGDYVIYDEDGFDLGPFDVRVVRASDDAEIPTEAIADGVSYDVGGHDGKAKVRVAIPTNDLYRVEVASGPGQVARFALGRGFSPVGSRIVGSLVLGAVLFVIGFVVLLVTGVADARWRVRHALASRVAQGREAVGVVLGSDELPGVAEQGVRERLDRVETWTRDAIAGARSQIDRLESSSTPAGTIDASLPPPPPAASTTAGRSQTLAERARQALDQAEARIPEVRGRVDRTADPAALANGIDAAMGRVDARLARGDSLRDIARDEGLAAASTAEELRTAAQQAAAELRRQAAAEADRAAATAAADFEGVTRAVTSAPGGTVGDLTGRLATAAEEVDTVASGFSGAVIAASVTGLAAAGAALAEPRSAPGAPGLGSPVDVDLVALSTAATPEPRGSEPKPPASTRSAAFEAAGATPERPLVPSSSILAPPPDALTTAAPAPGRRSQLPGRERFVAVAPPPAAERSSFAPPRERPRSAAALPDTALPADAREQPATGARSAPAERASTSFALAPPPDYGRLRGRDGD